MTVFQIKCLNQLLVPLLPSSITMIADEEKQKSAWLASGPEYNHNACMIWEQMPLYSDQSNISACLTYRRTSWFLLS